MTRRIPTARQMEQSRKVHHFADIDDPVITQLNPNGDYAAWVDGNEDGVYGLGDTMLEAIHDLNLQLEAAE